MFILNDLVVVQSNADNQRTDERCVCESRVSPCDPFSVDLQKMSSQWRFEIRIALRFRTYGNHGISVLVSGSHGGAEVKAISAPI